MEFDVQTQESLDGLRESTGLSPLEAEEAWKAAGKIFSDNFDGRDGKVSRWKLMSDLLFNEELSRAQVIFASYIVGQIMGESGKETSLL